MAESPSLHPLSRRPPEPFPQREATRWRLLSELGRGLGDVLDGEELLSRMADLLVGDVADYCITYLLEDGRVRRVGTAHADPRQEQLVRRLVDVAPPRLEDAHGAGMVLRTGTPTLAAEIPPGLLERVAAGEYLDILRALGPVSSIVLPLRARGRTLGAVALATTVHSGRHYGDADLVLAQELAGRAALALDNARLYGEARAELARRETAEGALRRRYEQLRVLYEMTEAVGRAGEVEEIYERALDGILQALEVDRASILLFDAEGVMRFKGWRGLSDSYRRAVEGHSPWTMDARDPAPIAVADVEMDREMDAGLHATILSEGIRGMAFIPLVFGGTLLGKFMLYSDRPRVLAAEEIELARTIAGTIAFAITRKLDERRVLEAKEAAERANESKSQFLGIMSHELRTPLNAVLGYTDLLLLEIKGALNPDQRHQLERIQTSARHQLGLVDEILTYARLEAGKEEPRLMETDPHRVIREVVELVRPEAERKGLRVVVEVPNAPLPMRTDPVRLRQIALNLAGNAVKYTEHGEVTVRGSREADHLVLEVVDTGPGIPEDRLDYVFEPFTRVDESHTRTTAGAGLGLAITRRLVALLEGEIEVRSRPGEGSTFAVRLPGLAG